MAQVTKRRGGRSSARTTRDDEETIEARAEWLIEHELPDVELRAEHIYGVQAFADASKEDRDWMLFVAAQHIAATQLDQERR